MRTGRLNVLFFTLASLALVVLGVFLLRTAPNPIRVSTSPAGTVSSVPVARPAPEPTTSAIRGADPSVPAATAPLAEPDLSANDEPREPATVLAQERQMKVHLDEQLLGETRDADFSSKMQARAKNELAAIGGINIRDMRCGSSLCRLDLALADNAAQEALVERVSALLPPNGEGFAYFERPDDREVEIYLARGPLP